MKKTFSLVLIAFLFLSLPVAFKRLTCGFKLAKTRLEMPHRADWEIVPILSEEQLKAILGQNFFYLDQGAQCYVFESQDKNHVLKLFRYDQPHFIKKKTKAFFQNKIEKLFTACLLAYRNAREETGLVHLHLNPTLNQLPILHAKGPIGQSLALPLDKYRFAIQKKAKPFRQSLAEALSDSEIFKKRIDSFLFLLHSRLDKGIGNSDPTLGRNFGFFGDRAAEIDFGNYFITDRQDEIPKRIQRLRRWLDKNAPEWVQYLDEKEAYTARE